MTERAFLSIKAAARKYGIPYWVMRAAVRNGRIKTVTLANRPLIPAVAMATFVADVNKSHAKVNYAPARAERSIATAGVEATA